MLELGGDEGVSSEQSSGMLLKILQCPGQSSVTRNDLTQNANSAEVEKPWFQLRPYLDLTVERLNNYGSPYCGL